MWSRMLDGTRKTFPGTGSTHCLTLNLRCLRWTHSTMTNTMVPLPLLNRAPLIGGCADWTRLGRGGQVCRRAPRSSSGLTSYDALTLARASVSPSAYGEGATSLLQRVGGMTSYLPWERTDTTPALGSPFSPSFPLADSERDNTLPPGRPRPVLPDLRGDEPTGAESAPHEWVMEQYISFVYRTTSVSPSFIARCIV